MTTAKHKTAVICCLNFRSCCRSDDVSPFDQVHQWLKHLPLSIRYCHPLALVHCRPRSGANCLCLRWLVCGSCRNGFRTRKVRAMILVLVLSAVDLLFTVRSRWGGVVVVVQHRIVCYAVKHSPGNEERYRRCVRHRFRLRSTHVFDSLSLLCRLCRVCVWCSTTAVCAVTWYVESVLKTKSNSQNWRRTNLIPQHSTLRHCTPHSPPPALFLPFCHRSNPVRVCDTCFQVRRRRTARSVLYADDD